MKYLEIIPDLLTMYGVFTSQSTSQVRQEMSIRHLSRLMGKPTMWFPNRFDTNRTAQSQKQARGLKGLYFRCSENKGADQLRGYREADLRLCFRLCRLLVFPTRCRGFATILYIKWLVCYLFMTFWLID